MRPVTLIRNLLRGVPKGRWRFHATVLLAAMASGASVALMGVSAWLISRAAEMPPVLYLQVAAVGVRFFAISRGVFRYVERLVGHDLALRMQSALRLQTYQKLSHTTLVGRRRGDLLTRVVADVAAVQDVVVRVAVPVLSASLVITGTSLMLARFSPASAALLFATAVLAGVIVPVAAQRASLAVDEAAAPTRGHLADSTRELVRASGDLLATGAHTQALGRVLAVDAELRRQESRGAWVSGLATAAQVIAAGIAVVAALAIGGPAVADGSLKPRLLAVLVLTPLAMHEVLATFTQAAQTWTRSRAFLGRIVDVLEAPTVGSGDATPPEHPAEGLRLTGVTVAWPGGDPVVENLSLEVRPGQRVALVGRSGAGKTTVAATVMGQIPPRSGTIERPATVGYLAQDAHIFATSVAENVRIGRRNATDEQVADALARAGLRLDPDRVIGEAGTTLSGGEQRRLALARVLVDHRELVILDEPTEHLDRPTADALMADVFAATRDSALLVITHDPDVMARCDRVVRL